jgi:hypothetical protein
VVVKDVAGVEVGVLKDPMIFLKLSEYFESNLKQSSTQTQ